MTDNPNWLAEYVQTGSDAAFRELVTRYVDLVYSTALRLVGGDPHRAEDVAQTVFINLARVARTLPKDVKLGGWLHRDTCFTASTLMRGERRRQSRERQAAEMNALQNTFNADYTLVAPLLDEAINELGDEDRTAILLRFFEQHDFRSVGAALGSNEDAARMRVTRALEKLESFLKRRGVTTTAASLGVVLSANAVQAAPVGLALTLSTAVVLTGTTLATTATVTATKAIAMTALQKTIVTATIAVLAGAGIYEARQSSQLRDQVQTLQQQQAPLSEQIQQLNQAAIAASNQIVSLRDDNERLGRNSTELLKLRGEVAKLRNDSQELAALKGGQSNDPVFSEAVAWRERVNSLKKYFDQNPDARIPEMQFLRELQWLEAAKVSEVVSAWQKLKLKNDEHYNDDLGAGQIKELAKEEFAKNMSSALRKFIEANAGELPTQLTQLKPYFTAPAGDDVLDRYEMLYSGNVKDISKYARNCALISEKKSVAETSTQMMIRIGEVTFSNLSSY